MQSLQGAKALGVQWVLLASGPVAGAVDSSYMYSVVRRILARLAKIKTTKEASREGFLQITRVFRQIRLKVSVGGGPEQAACMLS